MSGNIKGVTFGNVHTSNFSGHYAYLSKVTVGAPSPKEYKIDIPGSDGILDMTEYFGGVSYSSRKLKFEFTFPQRGQLLHMAYSAFLTAFNGKKFRIILDDDPQFFYRGRVRVGELSKSKLPRVTVECECEPFKYSVVTSQVTFTVNSCNLDSLGWVYGDVNGDGEVTSLDKTSLIKNLNKRTFESAQALRADFDLDGKVSNIEREVFNDYFNDTKGYTFQAYVEAGWAEVRHSDFVLRNWTRQTVNFGTSPVDVTFSRTEAAGGIYFWDLRIDNISQFGLRGLPSYTTQLKGVHDVMITTANTNETAVITAAWNNSGGF